ncbi:hypothetical protein JXA02_07490 [candidate division KSB1 bacterium]|nr:hypothetical protein [candidate division KSB1 bacterium]RQW06453.1 MAG: hypothetical protein EH222_08705 [candidate division KSB1 bacterium]
MAESKNDRILTILVIFFSVAGMIYFGLSAVRSDGKKTAGNPFHYDIENFKKDGADLRTYKEVKAVPLTLLAPHAIAVDLRDRIYVTSGASVVRIDAAGQMSVSTTVTDEINAIAVSADGDIYLALRTAVEVLDSTGTRTASWQIPDQAVLTSVAVAGRDVYLADAGNRVVWRYDLQGTLLNKIGERDEARDIVGFLIPSPYFDVAIDPDGFLWAVNTGRHQFENYFPDGALRSSWSNSSMAIDGFSGCCNPAHIAILSDGSFVTSEKGILRIKVHKQIGALEAVVATADQFDPKTSSLEVTVDSRDQILVLDPQRAQVRIFQKKEDPP